MSEPLADEKVVWLEPTLSTLFLRPCSVYRCHSCMYPPNRTNLEIVVAEVGFQLGRVHTLGGWPLLQLRQLELRPAVLAQLRLHVDPLWHCHALQ